VDAEPAAFATFVGIDIAIGPSPPGEAARRDHGDVAIDVDSELVNVDRRQGLAVQVGDVSVDRPDLAGRPIQVRKVGR